MDIIIKPLASLFRSKSKLYDNTYNQKKIIRKLFKNFSLQVCIRKTKFNVLKMISRSANGLITHAHHFVHYILLFCLKNTVYFYGNVNINVGRTNVGNEMFNVFSGSHAKPKLVGEDYEKRQ